MTTKILICDDSSFARKQITRSLPPQWDVEVFYAEDGHEGMRLIKEHEVSVVFLDLTMPNLDGYGVLELLKQEGIQTTVLVTSADIQPGAQDRVKALGAAGFIQKPLDAESVKNSLIEIGILTGK